MITTEYRRSLPTLDPLDFALPPEREATAPPEARGLARDGVRLMVSTVESDKIVHTVFSELHRFLDPGDLIVVNTSGTLAAALPTLRKKDGRCYFAHFSTQLTPGRWVIELRRPVALTTESFRTAESGEQYRLPAGGELTLLRPYGVFDAEFGVRLWEARVELPGESAPYLTAHGQPIRYSYVPDSWPLSYYQTVYATEPGSAEMPSAGRAFTPEGITRLVAKGIGLVPLILHTGVASLEDHEPPYAEQYRVPEATARAVNSTRASGNRVVAVGTTVVRALETVADTDGNVRAWGVGWNPGVDSSESGLIR
jgi:S-adenosylmethionine:tRNA ribosyltransferase-isomerase